MRASELISQYNNERPNKVSDAVKLRWLMNVDRMIMNEVILTHEIGKDLEDKVNVIEEGTEGYAVFDGVVVHPKKRVDAEAWFDGWDEQSELLAPEPYTELYLRYLDQRIAMNNNETARYNYVSKLYNDAYISYQAWYNRTHMPVSPRKKFLMHDNL